MATAANKETAVKIWDDRLGRVDKEKVRFMLEQSSDNRVMTQDRPDAIDCTPCAQGNQVKLSYKGTLVDSDAKIGDVTFSDVCGPMLTK
jgi:hypothetical protein